MEKILFYAVIAMLVVAVVVLTTGISVFVKGGETNRRHGNKLMNMRVAANFIIWLLMGLAFLWSRYYHK